jgi:methylthioribose-1-phosphate isomerase
MLVDGNPMRTIWPGDDASWPMVHIIDQTALPWALKIMDLRTVDHAARAIANMHVRGAPLIGATAAWGMALAMHAKCTDLDGPAGMLNAARPTAVNLGWAVRRMVRLLRPVAPADRKAVAFDAATAICNNDVAANTSLGEAGLDLLRAIHERTGTPVRVMTICNAGWLATVDRGTATAPIYAAQDAGVPVHVTCLETRPRGQGARLTAWELQQQGVEHCIVVDGAAASIVAQGLIDVAIVGTDRTAANGDVCNKIGTYALSLACKDNAVPFWVAAPTSSIDAHAVSGHAIPIEYRSDDEVTHVVSPQGESVAVTNPGSAVVSPAFDVTPARLVTGLLTEHGPCEATRAGILGVLQRHDSQDGEDDDHSRNPCRAKPAVINP